jgi:hypothetical protein
VQQVIKRFWLFLVGLGLVLSLSVRSMATVPDGMLKAIAQPPASNSNTDATDSIVTLTPPPPSQPATLIGRAVLPADTFVPGPVSGQFLTPGAPSNNRPVPFNGQPVQGFSAILLNPDGSYYLLADNGYGAKSNSPDFLLTFYRMLPNFRTPNSGLGNVSVLEAVRLSDPDRKVGFPIIADLKLYPKDPSANPFPTGPLSNFPVDPTIRTQRLLTGADFDLESFRRAPDGSFWFGEEFGPYLLHTDANGKLLEPPYSVPIPPQLQQYGRGVNFFRAPQNPALFNLPNDATRLNAANIRGSKGFEGMALSPDGIRLYPLLEGPMLDDPDQSRLIIAEFEIPKKRFTGRYFFYKLSVPANLPAPNRNKIGDMTAVNDHEFLVIETDDGQGTTAAFKKVFKIDINRVDAQGFVSKEEVADLLNISNPFNLAADAPPGSLGTGNPFTFPFVTIEDIQIIDNQTILIVNDNNYPTTGGNGRRANDIDNNEFILLRLAQPLNVTTRN